MVNTTWPFADPSTRSPASHRRMGGAVFRRRGQFGEGHWKPVSCVDVHAEYVMASAEVLNEGVSRVLRQR